jgi:Potential Queuosine, Q, salvage protein family
MREVLDSAGFVVERSKRVHIHEPAVSRFCETLLRGDSTVPPWDREIHFFDGGEAAVNYLFVLDTLNFCFWPPPGRLKWEIDHGEGTLSGYGALAASLTRAVQSGTPLLDAGYLSRIDFASLRQILGGRGTLQLLSERVKGLNELGAVLQRDWGGQAVRMVADARKSAARLVSLVTRHLSSFRDVATYAGRDIPFYKRAQILVADLHGAFRGGEWGEFQDLETLTAFADYKLPQALRELGILLYDEALSARVDGELPIESGSPEEVEIRACTIWTVELIRRQLERSGKGLRAYEIDWVLWNMAQEPIFKKRPYHRTLTVYY